MARLTREKRAIVREMALSSRIARVAVAVGLVAAALTGCATVDDDGRHLVPIPAQLVAKMNEKGMNPSDPIFIRIFKQESELEVWKRARNGEYALLKTYPMCRWSGKLGPKKREGDRQAPEGVYTVTPALMNPKSQYYLSFNLGYPNPLEAAQGYTGSALMVHGACTSAGCFAMTDSGVAEIYAVAREAFNGGQGSFQVQALPFRMTPANLAKHRDNPNMAFWRNLKEGSDHFDIARQPPTVAACARKYVFNAKAGGTFDPAGACPSYEVEPTIATKVAEKRKADEAAVAALVAAPAAAPLAYADGGMHPDFREILKSAGVERLQAMTSGRVPVSRPDAALVDPYVKSVGEARAAGR